MKWFLNLFRRGNRKKTTAGAAAGGVLVAAAAFVAPWEGRELNAYRDIVGVWTVCYGHTVGVRAGDSYTPEECTDMLANDLKEYNDRLMRCVDDPIENRLPENVEVAITSWAYNVGTGAACSSTLVRKLNAGDFRGACNELPRWNKAGGKVVRGLTRRREAERKLCLENL